MQNPILTYTLSNKLFNKSRLGSLYSDFSQLAESNPEGYDANIHAWKSVLLNINEYFIEKDISNHLINDRLIINFNKSLISNFYLDPYGLPLSLNTVINDCAKNNELIPFNEFILSNSNTYFKSFVSWCAKKSSGIFFPFSSNSNSEQYIITSQLKRISNEFLAKFPNLINENIQNKNLPNVYTISHLKIIIKTPLRLSDEDFPCLLWYFVNTLKICSVSNSENGYVSVCDGDSVVKLSLNSSSADKGINNIKNDLNIKKNEKINTSNDSVTDIDIIRAKLKFTIYQYELEMTQLHDSADSYLKKINSLSTQSATLNKKLSLHYLRKHKILVGKIDKIIDEQKKLESIQIKIENAISNKNNLDIMQMSADALKELNNSMDLDKINDLHDEINAECILVDETMDTITNNPISQSSYDDEEIENELNELMKQSHISESPKIENKKKNPTLDDSLKNLPKVPSELDKDKKSAIENETNEMAKEKNSVEKEEKNMLIES